MKSKNKKIIFTVIIAIVLIVLALGFTYAKYISSIEQINQLSVAGWRIAVNGYNGDFVNKNPNITTTNDGVELYHIAPGTGGEFELVIDATGTQTAVDYVIEYQEELSDMPVNLYLYDENSYENGQLTHLFMPVSGTIYEDDENKVVSHTVKYMWDYETTWNGLSIEENDRIDTMDAAKFEGMDATISLKVTATQSQKVNLT